MDPNVIGRFVDVHASPMRVSVTCEGRAVAEHARCWAHRVVVSDPAHVAAAATLRAEFNQAKAARELTARRAARHGVRHHDDGTTVALRALPDYDALFGVDFDPVPAAVTPGQTGDGERVEASAPQAGPEPGPMAGDQLEPTTPAVRLPRTLVLPPSALTR